jgi:hypothetical protein
MRFPIRPGLIVLGCILGSVSAVSAVAAQDSAPIPGNTSQLAVTDAHIEGSGPWTSLFGAAPDRKLVITVVNTGSTAIDAPEFIITLGKGADPERVILAPEFGRLEPGQPATVQVDLDLPAFAVGTYAVEGSFANLTTPVGFRAETSHIPWLALTLPLLILIQLCLVLVRNRVRDRIHRPLHTSDSTLPDPAPVAARAVVQMDEPEPAALKLEAIIGEELRAVFDEAFRHGDESLDDAGLSGLVIELAETAASRAAVRANLDDAERAVLHAEMTNAVLGAFDLERNTPVGAH